MKNTIKISLVVLFLILLVVIVFLLPMSPKMDDVGILKTFIPYELKVSNDDIERDPVMGLRTQLELRNRPIAETLKWYQDKKFEIIKGDGIHKGLNHAGATFSLTGNGEKSSLEIRYFADGKY